MHDRSRKTHNIVAATIGNTLEFYDFTVYAAFSTFLSQAYFPTGNPHLMLLLSTVIFGIGFLSRPIGAMVMGAYADRYGRKQAMTLTIWLMALGSLMIGVLPGYATLGLAAPLLLTLARLIQGFSAGGEMGSTTAFLVESSARDRVGLAASWQIATQNIGSIISGLGGIGLGACLSNTQLAGWGWRLPFLFGAIIAPVGFWIRRNVDETLHVGQTLHSMGTVISHLLTQMPGRIALCIMLVAGNTVAQYFFLYGTIFSIHDLHFPAAFSISINIALGVVGFPGALLGGYLADRHGPFRIVLVTRFLLCVLLVPAFMLLLAHPTPTVFTIVIMFLMSFHAVSTGACICLLPAMFPMKVRTLGTGLSYALGVTIFGGTAQPIFTMMIANTGNNLSWIYYVVGMLCISSLSLIFLWRMPGTRTTVACADR
ncbi:alpha-ketoglutarate permease [Komagataeibacter europaeus]|uniref:Alpha-ketoglutarate permease n=1 Tax=Komagataeibacter europaeus TaxID=33995 RepID=A0A0M0EFM8_KOMEU|nr:MFS transporter [Komagataeibacter europaeus]KON64064.1 alpha-ketoglutarate permease [Komagataeibacter europaeus]